jgi:hypothetical protein
MEAQRLLRQKQRREFSDATAKEVLVLPGRVDRLLDGDTLDVPLEGDDQTTRAACRALTRPRPTSLCLTMRSRSVAAS